MILKYLVSVCFYIWVSGVQYLVQVCAFMGEWDSYAILDVSVYFYIWVSGVAVQYLM